LARVAGTPLASTTPTHHRPSANVGQLLPADVYGGINPVRHFVRQNAREACSGAGGLRWIRPWFGRLDDTSEGHPRRNHDENGTFKSARKNAIYTPASVLMALRM
jgi:hypothetical protein